MERTIKDWNEEERPREKMLAKGCSSLTAAELIAILIRSGSNTADAVETSHNLLALADGKLCELSRMSIDRMCSIEGIGLTKAMSVTAACELARRMASEKSYDNPIIRNSAVAAQIMRPDIGNLRHEECWLMFLNKGRRLLGRERITKGGVDLTVMDIKMMVSRSLEKLSSGVILVHNHPSGNPQPSVRDREQTESLRKALALLDIQLCDHIIICQDKYYSFSEEIITKFA